MSDVPNDELFTDDFVEDHVVREEPSQQLALQIARERNLALSTLIFLPAKDFNALADDVRRHHRPWVRRPPRDRQLFMTEGVYPCITVSRDGPPITFQAGEVSWSRLQFAVKEAGTVQLNGRPQTVYAIGHLETADAVGQPRDAGDDDEHDDDENDDI